jgi:hypothetical protein
VQEGDTLQAKFISSFLRAGRVLAISDDAKQISAIAQKVKSSHKSGKKFSNMTVQLQAFVVTVWSREPSAQLHLVLQLTNNPRLTERRAYGNVTGLPGVIWLVELLFLPEKSDHVPLHAVLWCESVRKFCRNRPYV